MEPKRTWFAVLEGSSNLGRARDPIPSNRTEEKCSEGGEMPEELRLGAEARRLTLTI